MAKLQSNTGTLLPFSAHYTTNQTPSHIAGEGYYHKDFTLSRHNAACQVVHAAIQKSAKGGWGPLQCAELSPRHNGRGVILRDILDLTGDPMLRQPDG
jgi:hypothetical protein